MGTTPTNGLVFDIQAHSVHDGPGTRTLVFMSGCPLRCKWCCNPEGLQLRPQLMYKLHKCVHCPMRCVPPCPHQAITSHEKGSGAPISIDRVKCESCNSFECVAHCYPQALQLSGKWMSADELIRVFHRDRSYWSRDGGVTFGGGEPLLQKDFVVSLLKWCCESHIHTTLETSAFVPTEHLLEALDYTSFLFADIKHMGDVQHRQGTGVSNLPILNNLRSIAASKWDGRIVIRCPIVPRFNDTVENAEATAAFMRELGFREINLLPFHRLGTSKYEQLGMTYDFANEPAATAESLRHLRGVYEAKHISCYIGFETPF